MSADPKDQHESHQQFLDQLMVSLTTNASILSYFGVSMLIMLTLGVGVWLIAFSLFWTFIIISYTHARVYRVLRRMLRSQRPPEMFVEPSLWRRVFNYSSLVLPAFFIFLGVKIVGSLEFCGYSPICLLISRLKP